MLFTEKQTFLIRRVNNGYIFAQYTVPGNRETPMFVATSARDLADAVMDWAHNLENSEQGGATSRPAP